MRLRITIEGNSYDVDVEVLDGAESVSGGSPAPVSRAAAPSRAEPPARTATPVADGDKALRSPIAGTILKVLAKPGDVVTVNQVVFIMEAMKMETNVASPVAGKIRQVHVSGGEAVKPGQLLLEYD